MILDKRTRENSRNIATVESITNKLTLNLEYAFQLVNGAYDDLVEVDDHNSLASVLKELGK